VKVFEGLPLRYGLEHPEEQRREKDGANNGISAGEK
jgi:hypothetical protein